MHKRTAWPRSPCTRPCRSLDDVFERRRVYADHEQMGKFFIMLFCVWDICHEGFLTVCMQLKHLGVKIKIFLLNFYALVHGVVSRFGTISNRFNSMHFTCVGKLLDQPLVHESTVNAACFVLAILMCFSPLCWVGRLVSPSSFVISVQLIVWPETWFVSLTCKYLSTCEFFGWSSQVARKMLFICTLTNSNI